MRLHQRFQTAFAAAFALLVLAFSAAGARAAMEIREITSPGGIKAWLVEDYTVPIVSLRYAFEGGTVRDPEGRDGLVRLMAALFDEGAGDLDAAAFQKQVDDIGAEMGFSASSDSFTGGLRVLAEEKDAAFELLALAINRPRFDIEPFERIRAQLITRIRSDANDPDAIANEKWEDAVFAGHPYARRSIGTEETLASIERDELFAVHKQLMGRDNLIVGIVGAIAAEDAGQALDRIFGALPESAAAIEIPEAVPALGKTIAVPFDRPQTSIRLTYPGVKRSDPDFFAAALLDHVLGGSASTSRLHNEVREKRGLAYSAGSALVTMDHAAWLSVATATRSERAAEALQVIRDVVADMAANGPTGEELAAAKAYTIGSYAIANLQSSAAVASTLVGMQQEGLPIDYIDRRRDLIESVSIDDVKRVAERLLSADPALLVVGPELEADGGKADQ